MPTEPHFNKDAFIETLKTAIIISNQLNGRGIPISVASRETTTLPFSEIHDSVRHAAYTLDPSIRSNFTLYIYPTDMEGGLTITQEMLPPPTETPPEASEDSYSLPSSSTSIWELVQRPEEYNKWRDDIPTTAPPSLLAVMWQSSLLNPKDMAMAISCEI